MSETSQRTLGASDSPIDDELEDAMGVLASSRNDAAGAAAGRR